MAAEPESAFATTLLGLINGSTRSASDRALFNLPANPKASESAPVRHIDGGSHASDDAST
jgi:hypothetical protein